MLVIDPWIFITHNLLCLQSTLCACNFFIFQCLLIWQQSSHNNRYQNNSHKNQQHSLLFNAPSPYNYIVEGSLLSSEDHLQTPTGQLSFCTVLSQPQPAHCEAASGRSSSSSLHAVSRALWGSDQPSDGHQAVAAREVAVKRGKLNIDNLKYKVKWCRNNKHAFESNQQFLITISCVNIL